MLKHTLCAAVAAAALLLSACAAAPADTVADNALPTLKIGSSIDEPYFYVGEDGAYIGIDKEIAVEACRRMGYTPEFTVFTWGNQDALLADGTVDCIWDSFAMNGREDDYQWAGPYLTDQAKVVVAADSDIYTLDDLVGRTIAVRISSKAEDYFLKESGTALLADSRTALCTFDSTNDAFAYFGKGCADAVVAHGSALRVLTAPHSGYYRYLDTSLMQLDLGVAFSKAHDPAVVAQLQQTLQEMSDDGTIAAIAAAYGEGTGAADGE